MDPDNLPAYQAGIRQRISSITDALLTSKPSMHTWAFLSLRKRKITMQDQVGGPEGMDNERYRLVSNKMQETISWPP